MVQTLTFMIDLIKAKLEERLKQREQLVANLHVINGAIDQLKELMDECVKYESSEPVKEEDAPG